MVEIKFAHKSTQVFQRLAPRRRLCNGFLRLARKLASPFGHPTQVSTQVRLATTCQSVWPGLTAVRLAASLDLKWRTSSSEFLPNKTFLTLHFFISFSSFRLSLFPEHLFCMRWFSTFVNTWVLFFLSKERFSG